MRITMPTVCFTAAVDIDGIDFPIVIIDEVKQISCCTGKTAMISETIDSIDNDICLFNFLLPILLGREQLFPNVRDPKRVMSNTTLNRVLERIGYAGVFSAHGFRATASTLLNEHGYRPDVIERQLAHQERNGVRASYNHATYLNERRQMMQEWADMLDGAQKSGGAH